jgi:hypothetical protein
MTRARELAETFINGNLSDCVDEIQEQKDPRVAAALALQVYNELVNEFGYDGRPLIRMLTEGVELPPPLEPDPEG